MGLFSTFKHIVQAVAPAVGSILGGPVGGALGGGISSLLGGASNKGAINGANGAIQAGLTNAEDALNSQFGKSEANFAPWITGGQQAFGQEGDILGLHGAGAQGSIIDQLKASPLFQSLFRTGHDTVLNDASATGGLRGGNITDHLAHFGSDTLAQVIQNQLQNLSGMSTQGLGAATSEGSFGAQNANALAELLTGSGKANAGSILQNQAVDNNTNSELQKFLKDATGNISGGGLFSKLFGGSGGGGGINLGSNPFAGALGSVSSLSAPDINMRISSPSAGLPF